jgi:aminocarboxymuconate-semialdehyde decarboxylase
MRVTASKLWNEADFSAFTFFRPEKFQVSDRKARSTRESDNLNIDMHAHFVPEALLDDLAAKRHSFPSISATGRKDAVRIAFGSQEPKRPMPAAMSDVDRRRRRLAEQRIEKQVVAGWLDIFGYDLPPDEGADWSRFVNEHMLKGVAQLEAFVPLATVPMQSGKLAAQVLEEALAAGFHGAMIGTQPKGMGSVLDDPDLDPFWEAAASRKATIIVHPTFGAHDNRLKAYGLVNTVGRITDSTIAVSRLLLSGHLLRYPGVNLVVAHGGGALPMVLGRLKNSFAHDPAGNADPGEGFSRLYFDTVVYDPRAIRFLCDVAGPSKLMMGTDQPFPNAEAKPQELIQCCGLEAKDQTAVLGGTAAKLFGIS